MAGRVASLDWLVVGGESGPGARPFDVAWARSIRDQCASAGVDYFHKQNGTVWARDTFVGGQSVYAQKDTKGEHPEFWPEDLRVRQYPR